MKTLAVIVEVGDEHGIVIDAVPDFEEAISIMEKLQKETGNKYQIYYSEVGK